MRQVVIPASLAHPPPFTPVQECLQLAGESMGTTWQVRVHAHGFAAQTLRTAIDETLAVVIRQMSHWEPDSDLSRFNAATAGTVVPLPDLLFELLTRAQQLSAITAGAFDATAGALARLWGFGPERARRGPGFQLPVTADVEAARSRCGWQRLSLDGTSRCAVQPGGMELDLSAIAKGFAVDLISQRLRRDGYPVHLVEIGGELRGAGVKPDSQPWWVTLEPPEARAQLDETVIALCDRAVATSGDYRRWHEQDGRRYPHTIDPRSGRPIDNAVASVSVLSEECWFTDAISTALTVMGVDAGLAFANRSDIAARFVRREQSGYSECCSRAWSEMLQ